MSRPFASVLAAVVAACAVVPIQAQVKERPIPRIVEKDGRYALFVDDAPYLMLGAQVHNSSSWPAELPKVWPAMEYLHVNTVEMPVYWEQFEPRPGVYDTALIDTLLAEARQHQVHLVILWFGTWKNGSQHYMPEWMKLDTVKYPHVIGKNGDAVDSPSPFAAASLEADKKAFGAFMRHLKAADPERTVIMVQVENESGTWGSLRDYSPVANKLFEAPVPPEVLSAMQVKGASPACELAGSVWPRGGGQLPRLGGREVCGTSRRCGQGRLSATHVRQCGLARSAEAGRAGHLREWRAYGQRAEHMEGRGASAGCPGPGQLHQRPSGLPEGAGPVSPQRQSSVCAGDGRSEQPAVLLLRAGTAGNRLLALWVGLHPRARPARPGSSAGRGPDSVGDELHVDRADDARRGPAQLRRQAAGRGRGAGQDHADSALWIVERGGVVRSVQPRPRSGKSEAGRAGAGCPT
jgi:hypothetical protein